MDETKDLMTGHEVVDVASQVAKIKDLMQTVMVPDLHYGVIPGTEKPTLLQPGAQKLCLTFGIGDRDLDMTERELQDGHREYRFHKEFYHRESGKTITEAWGTCSTMESRYRWRKFFDPIAGVPGPYWKIPKDDMEGKQDFLVKAFGPGKFRVRKVEGEWMVVRVGEERTENPDIADQYNTVMAIADKRAYVRGTIKALAASDLFTPGHDTFSQGIEEDQESGSGSTGRGAGSGGKKDTGKKDASRGRKKEETTRQGMIERIAVVVAGPATRGLFTDGERKLYASEIESGGPSGGSMPTEDLEKLVEEVEAELERKQIKKATEDPQKDELDRAADEGWDKSKKKDETPRTADPHTEEVLEEGNAGKKQEELGIF